MTESIVDILHQIRPLHDLVRDLEVVELSITRAGAVRVRRQDKRQLEQITISSSMVTRLSEAINTTAGHELTTTAHTIVAEQGPMRWIKVEGPLVKEGTTIFALRVRPPRVTTSELVREGFISRRAIRQIENTVKNLRGVVIVGPPRSGKTRLMTSLIGRLRTNDGRVLVLEGHIDLDTEGLELTSLRRRLLPKNNPERAIFEDLICRADIVVADDIHTVSDWGWVYPPRVGLPYSHGRLLAITASSEQEALVVLKTLAQVEDHASLEALGIDLMVMCNLNADGTLLATYVGSLPKEAEEAPKPAPVKAPPKEMPKIALRTTKHLPRAKAPPIPQNIDLTTLEPPEIIREDASIDDSFEEEKIEVPATVSLPQPAVLLESDDPPIMLEVEPDASSHDEIGETGELEDPIVRLQRRLSRNNKAMAKKPAPPRPSTPPPLPDDLDATSQNEEVDILFLPTDLSEEESLKDQPFARSNREPTQPSVPILILDEQEDDDRTQTIKAGSVPGLAPNSTQESAPSTRSSLSLKAVPSGSSRSSGSLPALRSGGLSKRKRRKLPGTLDRKKSSKKEEESPSKSSENLPSAKAEGGARFSRAGRAFTNARVLDRPSSPKGKEPSPPSDSALVAKQPALPEQDSSRAAGWAARRKAYTNSETLPKDPVPEYDQNQDEATIMRDSRRLATPREKRLSELEEDVPFDEMETNSGYDSDSTSQMSKEVLSRGMKPYHHVGDQDKTLPRSSRKKNK